MLQINSQNFSSQLKGSTIAGQEVVVLTEQSSYHHLKPTLKQPTLSTLRQPLIF